MSTDYNSEVMARRILVTNDDGYRSEGIPALRAALAALGEVTIVAPTTEASAIGHALTLRRPLRLETIAAGVFAVDGTLGYAKAEVTAGGVDLAGLHPKTLESKYCPGLFFASEILDVDGRIGGFNFQWAWSSGAAAAAGIIASRGPLRTKS